jgi:hypothetical protein
MLQGWFYFYFRTSFESLTQKVEEFGNRLDRVENLAKEIATRKTDSESDKKIFCISIMSFLDFSNALKGKFVSISDHTQSWLFSYQFLNKSLTHIS